MTLESDPPVKKAVSATPPKKTVAPAPPVAPEPTVVKPGEHVAEVSKQDELPVDPPVESPEQWKPPEFPKFVINQRGAKVIILQRALKTLGYYPARIAFTTEYESHTQLAVMRFHTDNSDLGDGPQITEEGWMRLHTLVHEQE